MWDFAVLTFVEAGCPDGVAPGYRAGWLGTWINPPNSYVSTNSVSLYGYPEACPGMVAVQQCGMDSAAWVDDWILGSDYMDESGGQSGAPWIIWNDGYFAIASHVGWAWNLWDGYFTYGRKIDSSYWSLISSVSSDY
jgi:hypothetical protein